MICYKNSNIKFKIIRTSIIQRMLLQQTFVFQPLKHAYFPNTQMPCIQVHQSGCYLAFSTRANQLILWNKKLNRSSVIYKSEHGIIDIKFTSQMIIVVEKGYHQIVCISLKTEKIKKKITGNRNQIKKIAYSRSRSLFAVITHQTCAIYNQFTLNREKLLKCSTSSFLDCEFSKSGQHLFTVFKDSTFFIWSLQDYSFEQHTVQQAYTAVHSSSSSLMCFSSSNSICLCSSTSSPLVFNKLQSFWSSPIISTLFVQQTLVIQTQQTLYLCEVYSQQGKYNVRNVKAMEGKVNSIRPLEYQNGLLLIMDNHRKIVQMALKHQTKNINQKVKNPLKNTGLYCAGGYSNSNGCTASDNFEITQIYSKQTLKAQNMNKNLYNQQSSALFSEQKLKEFLYKHHLFPPKHRASSFKFMLSLPINPSQYISTVQKGPHECVQFLQKKYPLQNKQISSIMKTVISALAWIDPVFAQYQHLPMILFPFVCLFGQDAMFCTEVVYRLMTTTMAFLVQEFPLPNSRFLQNAYQIMEIIDPELIRHFMDRKITFTKVTWSMLSSFFTANLPKQAFLALLDNIICRPNQPHFIMFIILGYLSYNRSRLLSLTNQSDLQTFLSQQHTVNTGKLLSFVFSHFQKHQSKVHYEFPTLQLTSSFEQMNHYPKDAVKMYRGRRKLQAEQYRKQDQDQTYRNTMAKDMENMTIKAKRNAQRQMIHAQSFNYHVQTQEKSRMQNFISDKKVSRQQRIERLQKLMQQLKGALHCQKLSKQQYKKNASYSISTNLFDQSDRELESLQLKLLKKLSNLKPSLTRPLHSIPINSFSNSRSDTNAFRSMINAEIAHKAWEMDEDQKSSREQQWENDMLRSMKA